jgi:hypothetical protein
MPQIRATRNMPRSARRLDEPAIGEEAGDDTGEA